MFGGHYYNLDAALAAGKISQAEYAAEILEGLINRANSLRLLCDQAGAGSDVDAQDYEHYVKSYLEDVEEARARAMRAGLCKEHGYHTLVGKEGE